MTRKTQSVRNVLASQLRSTRKLAGISQEELAARAGLHRTYVGSVERGERNISIDNIERLARALKVSVIDLLGGGDQ